MRHAYNWIFHLMKISLLLVIFIAICPSAKSEIKTGPTILNPAIPNLETQSNVGAAQMSIPIEVPPGRQGVEPDLKFVYNSFNHNSWIGVGWDLDMGAIQRSTKRGTDYNSDHFVVLDNGTVNELVSRQSTWGAGYYGLKIESEFSKYRYDYQDNHWEVTRRDGTKYCYGTDIDSRQSNSKGTFKWFLDKIEDTNGNFMTISYLYDQGRLYLSQIRYTGNSKTGAVASNLVEFELENRDDIIVSFRSNTEVKTDKRLASVRIYTIKDSESWLVRTYKLTYENEDSAGYSRLSKVQLYGHDESVPLPPILIDWHPASTGDFGYLIGNNILRASTRNKREKAFIADVNGDSKTDIVVTSWRHWMTGPPTFEAYFSLSNGDGSFTQAQYFPVKDRGQLINFADVDGDGLSDVTIYYLTEVFEYYYTYHSNGDGTFDRPKLTRMLSTVKKDSKAYFGDINGDGYSDIIFQWGIFLYLRLSNGDGSFSKKDIRFPIRAPNILGFADVNGDGLADCLGYRNQYPYRYFYVYLSKGDGSFGQEIFSPIPGAMHEDAIPSLGDVNGDGMVDVVFAYHGFTYFKLSEGDGTFRAGSEIYGLTASDGLYLSDVNGDGADDLFQVIISSDNAVRVNTNLSNFSGSPFLMAGFTDRTGARTTFSYSHSNSFTNTFLPFVVQALTAVTVDDGFGNLSRTQYDYSGGYFDSENRSFRGYERVKKTNPDNSIIETVFHQGPHNSGRPYQIDLKEPEGNEALLSRKSLKWNIDQLDNAAFVKLSRKKTDFFDAETIYEQEDYTYDSAVGLMTEMVSGGTGGPVVKHQYNHLNLGKWLWRKSEERLLDSNEKILRRTFYTYQNETGNLLSTEQYLGNGDNPKVVYGYDLYGNITHYYDANGNPPQITLYDATTNTYPIEVINPVGHVSRFTWDYKFGRKSSETDPNGNTTFYNYDAFGRLVRIDYPDGGEELNVYTDCLDPQCSQALIPRQVLSKEKEQASPDVYVDRYEYFDGLGRSVQTITLGEGKKTIVSKQYYDEMGRIRKTKGPFFSTLIGYPIDPPSDIPYSETFYDYRSRPTRVEVPLGNSSQPDHSAVTYFEYNGFSTTIADPDNCLRTEKRDYLNRVIQVSEHTGSSTINTNYSYNAAGDLTSVTNHGSITTFIRYDTLGRKISMDDPDMGYWQYAYDANGNLTSQTDAKLQTTYFEYDAINRPIKKTYSTSGSPASYLYDEVAVTNGIGRLFKIENENATTSYKAYDAMGRELLVERSIAGAPLPSYPTTYSYDLTGKLTSMVYPDNYQVNYAYFPGSNLIKSVVGLTDFKEYAEIEDYRPTGKIGYIYHGNGTATTYLYDSESTRLLSIIARDSSFNTILDKNYKYSAGGDIVEITDSSGTAPVTYNYSYDELHRLISETNSGGIDSFENAALTKLYDDAAPFHAPKKIVSRGLEYGLDYDANGNLTTGYDFSDPANVTTRAISYNPDNMPTQIACTKTGYYANVNFYYDSENKRVKKAVQGGSTNFYINNNFEIIDGVETKYIFVGDLRIAKVSSAGTLYYHKDHLGSSSVVTDWQSGSSVETTLFLPFGLTRYQSGQNTSNYKFTDQELDPEIGLYNYDARLYDPVAGIFITPDSIVPGDGFYSQFLNRYAYVGNNPLKYIDPSGHWFRDPSSGENFASDPSNYDVDYGGNYGNPGSFSGTHVDANDGHDPGETGWEYSDSLGDWIDHRGDGAKLAGNILTEASLSFTPLTFITKARWLSKLKWVSKLKTGGNASKKGGLNLFKWYDKTSTKATGWKEGDRFLYFENKGSSKEKWKKLYGLLRAEEKKGKPIYDSYSKWITGAQKKVRLTPYDDGQYLNAERYFFESRGWQYFFRNRAYYPPKK